jgi:hypothetical protein
VIPLREGQISQILIFSFWAYNIRKLFLPIEDVDLNMVSTTTMSNCLFKKPYGMQKTILFKQDYAKRISEASEAIMDLRKTMHW